MGTILTPGDEYRSELVEIARHLIRQYEARAARALWQDEIDRQKARIAFILRHDTQPPITFQAKQAHARALKNAREALTGGRSSV